MFSGNRLLNYRIYRI